MRAFKMLFAAIASLCFVSAAAEAAVVVRVDKSTQTMRVVVDGQLRHSWSVSTGRSGYNTPVGTYRVQRMERMWHSRKYNMSPMPHSIFFRGGYAIHGTGDLRRLGRTASHGCIRLAPANARVLFDLVASQRGATRIVIEGTSRHQEEPVVASRRAPRVAAAASTTAQMRMARLIQRDQVRAANGNQRQVVRASSTSQRAVPVQAASPRGVAAQPAYLPPVYLVPHQTPHYMEWYLRR